jgi:hypothetical protein
MLPQISQNYFSFEVLKKKIWANFHRIIELFTQKIVTKLSKIWIWDPGSGKNLFRIPDPAGQKGTGSRIRNTGYRDILYKNVVTFFTRNWNGAQFTSQT